LFLERNSYYTIWSGLNAISAAQPPRRVNPL
jgi:hypothetical protein